jgi:hypothetical protein
MFPLEDLAQVAEDLRKRSVDAQYTILGGLHGALEGLEIGEDFFPLWELSLPENQAALETLDFEAIKARRAANWSVKPPKYARSAGV